MARSGISIPKDLPHPRNDLHRHQRMSAEREEVVVAADFVDRQQLRPDRAQSFFCRVRRRFVRRLRALPRFLRLDCLGQASRIRKL